MKLTLWVVWVITFVAIIVVVIVNLRLTRSYVADNSFIIMHVGQFKHAEEFEDEWIKFSMIDASVGDRSVNYKRSEIIIPNGLEEGDWIAVLLYWKREIKYEVRYVTKTSIYKLDLKLEWD